jgi:hypothetical protein
VRAARSQTPQSTTRATALLVRRWAAAARKAEHEGSGVGICPSEMRAGSSLQTRVRLSGRESGESVDSDRDRGAIGMPTRVRGVDDAVNNEEKVRS